MKGSGPVNVLYAGSLVALMEKQISPAFDTATGYTFTGFAGGSTALAAQIKGKIRQGDVFISASPKVNASLEGAGNGGWVSWYARFASSPLVLGYNPHSKFAQELKTKPWYQVVTQTGFRLGSTDPATDPKGKLAVEALTNAARTESEPALSALAKSTESIYPEETLVGRLQAGQLDAGFFYSSEAVAANIVTVPLTGQHLKATYTVTVLNKAPHAAAAEAFIAFLLGPDGQSTLKKDGFALTTPPSVHGSGVPASLRDVLHAT
ncbi:MAG: extracellular solute-binding protein [Dermatophilaceae bacterium]